MLLLINTCLTQDTPGFLYSRGLYPPANKLDVLKYMLASYAAIPHWTRVILYCQLEGEYAAHEGDLRRYVHALFDPGIVEYHDWRHCQQSTWQQLAADLLNGPDDLIFYMGNHDHPFMASSLEDLDRGLALLRAHPDSNCGLMISHLPEMLAFSEMGVSSERRFHPGGYMSMTWGTRDAMMVTTPQVFYDWWHDFDYGKRFCPRPDWPWFAELGVPPKPLHVYVPPRRLCEHFDGYAHVHVDINWAPPLTIPTGFFQENIKICFGSDIPRPGWFSINPLVPDYTAISRLGTDARWIADDIPLFWRTRISEIDVADEAPEHLTLHFRNEAYQNYVGAHPFLRWKFRGQSETLFNLGRCFTQETTPPQTFFKTRCDKQEHPAFCILAAGMGTRAESGFAHKALLPLAGKAAISHIIEKAPPGSDIVVAVGYKADQVREYCEAAHPDRRFIFVPVDKYEGSGSGPRYSLRCCRPYLERPFYLVTADCLFDEPIAGLDYDWIGVAPTDRPQQFATVECNTENHVTAFCNKSDLGFNLAYIGVSGHKDYGRFWTELDANVGHDRDYELVCAWYHPERWGDLRTVPFTWHDTGTVENYQKAREAIGGKSYGMPKVIQELTYNVNGRCIKVFGDSKVLEGRIRRGKALVPLVPPLAYSGQHVYAYEWVAGTTLYQASDIQTLAHFLTWCQAHLWNVSMPQENFTVNCREFYQDKTLARLADYEKSRPHVLDMPCVVNGRTCRPIRYYLDEMNLERLCDGVPVLFHGDLQFQNVVHRGVGEYVLIDWRDGFAGAHLSGDLYYDLAKLYGGVLINYDSVALGNYTYVENDEDIAFQVDTTETLTAFRPLYEEWLAVQGYDVERVKWLTGLVLLSMSPLHPRPCGDMFFHQAQYLFSTLEPDLC